MNRIDLDLCKMIDRLIEEELYESLGLCAEQKIHTKV